MQLLVGPLQDPPIDAQRAEIVERKGLGHPDSICDALAEELSLALARHDVERFGTIQHHNVDKVLLWAGRSQPRFGGGRILAPIEIFLAGRASRASEASLPLEELTIESARGWLRRNLRWLDVERDVRVHCLVRPGSGDLEDLYRRRSGATCPRANDTSCGVGYAPLSDLESLVLRLERHLTAEEVRRRRTAFGEDVKVMGVRFEDRIRLTVACALVDRHLADARAYLRAKQQLAELALEKAEGLTSRAVELEVNLADDPSRESFYLTVTGTSAESGDDGQAGRGNRANGLITPYRPMTLESVAGKNPMTHVGKLYNVAAGLIAEAVVNELAEVEEAECRLVSQIGRPVDDPQLVEVGVRSAQPLSESLGSRAEEIARDLVQGIGELWRQFLDGTIAVNDWPLRRRRP